MAIINTIIPPASFEIVRDRVHAILAEELANQAVLSPGAGFSMRVYKERSVPPNQDEAPMINVRWIGTPYSAKTMVQSNGTNTYQIDIYTSAKTTATDSGDSLALVKLHRLMGITRSIFANPKYKTLGYQPPFVMRSSISALNLGFIGEQDAMSYVIGTVMLDVDLPESTELIIPNLIAGSDTTLKLENSNQGYYYQT